MQQRVSPPPHDPGQGIFGIRMLDEMPQDDSSSLFNLVRCLPSRHTPPCSVECFRKTANPVPLLIPEQPCGLSIRSMKLRIGDAAHPPHSGKSYARDRQGSRIDRALRRIDRSDCATDAADTFARRNRTSCGRSTARGQPRTRRRNTRRSTMGRRSEIRRSDFDASDVYSRVAERSCALCLRPWPHG